MSNIAIKGATTGTGTFTIESPATNTDRTLTLPDEAGTVLTSASDIASTKLTGTLGVDASGNVTVNSSGTTTPTYDYSTLGEGIHLRYWDQSGARHADIVATGNTPAGATQDLRFFTNSGGSPGTATERMRVTSDGDVFINTTSAVADSLAVFAVDGSVGFQSQGRPCLTVNRQVDNGNAIELKRGGNTVGKIQVTTTSTSYVTSSDYRLKENVVDMTGAIDRVKQLSPSRFNFIAEPDTTVDGFLAHEAQAVVPEAVSGTHNEVDDEGNPVYQGIDQSKLVPLLTGALQEAIARIETLEAEVATLKGASA